MNYSETDEFTKSFRRLSKKYRSLPDDLGEFKKVVSSAPLGIGKHFAVLQVEAYIKVVKARLFCRYLRGSSLRIVYGYEEDCQTITFIELYFKGEQENESRGLINSFLLKHT